MGKNDVKIKDRVEEVEYLRMALNMCQINVDYVTTDLIIQVSKKLDKLKGNFTLYDGVKTHYKWKEKWSKYFEKLNDNDQPKA